MLNNFTALLEFVYYKEKNIFTHVYDNEKENLWIIINALNAFKGGKNKMDWHGNINWKMQNIHCNPLWEKCLGQNVSKAFSWPILITDSVLWLLLQKEE